jgi:hypothetical protein
MVLLRDARPRGVAIRRRAKVVYDRGCRTDGERAGHSGTDADGRDVAPRLELAAEKESAAGGPRPTPRRSAAERIRSSVEPIHGQPRPHSSHLATTASRHTPPGRQPANRTVQNTSGLTQRTDRRGSLSSGSAAVAVRISGVNVRRHTSSLSAGTARGWEEAIPSANYAAKAATISGR